jgi:toxin ParE1/3/4
LSQYEYFLTDAAYDDLDEIADYTAQKWVVSQEKKYLAQLFKCFEELARNPRIGRERPEIEPEYRSVVEGGHVIFYRIRDTRVEILGIVHGQRDLKREMGKPNRA